MKNLKRISPQLMNSPWLLRVILIGVIVSGAFLAGAVAFVAVRGLVVSQSGSFGANQPELIAGEQAVNAEGTPLPNLPSAPVEIAPSLNPWDGASRVTILLVGLDYRDWESGTDASRSDTMILLTLDPLSNSAGMLSIPRDMWVPIPGFTHGKINTAYYLGDAYKLPGGGPALATKTVEQFLGVPINYYAQIDFAAFVRFIDEIGGVKINVPEKIQVDPLGDNNTKTLKPGVQTLPGDLALAYARNRKTQGGDFDRAQRQQQVIFGIRDRILNLDMLPTLIGKAPTLYQELSSGINTNLSLDEAIKLALLAKDVPEENIKKGVLNQEYTLFGWSPDNLSILIPIPDKIHILRDEIFASSSGLGPETPGDAQAQMQAEAARLAILNGSGATGLAERTADFLRAQGANVAQVESAAEGYPRTRIVDYTGNPYIIKYLAELMQVTPDQIRTSFNPSSPVDVEVYLGSDWASGNSLP